MGETNARDFKTFHTGTDDGLEPLEPLDITACNDVDELLQAMAKTAFGARNLGEAAEVLCEMVEDSRCSVVLTLSGAMTVAKMSLLVCEMIERGMVHAVVSTGALMSHGLVEAAGFKHFKYRGRLNDKTLYKRGYDRVYDTLELEQNLIETESIFKKAMLALPKDAVLCSRKVTAAIGEYLSAHEPGRGILKSAFEKKVPIYIPAFTDSEMGLDFAAMNRRLTMQGEKPFRFDPFLDLEDFAEWVRTRERLGIFTIGGGVPRNWAQQASPYLEQLQVRNLADGSIIRYRYGVRICPDPAYLGGLSGCTYSEGVSWGKFIPPDEGGRWAEVHADATIAWPILLKAVIERLDKRA